MSDDIRRDEAADARDVKAEARDLRTDAREVRVDAQHVKVGVSASRIYGYLRVMGWMMFVLGVLLTVSLIRSFLAADTFDKIDEGIHRLEVAAERTDSTSVAAREAAVEARDELREAIARIDAPSDRDSSVTNALAAIGRIEVYLCGGPCPDVDADTLGE
jgi:hypothetical protein